MSRRIWIAIGALVTVAAVGGVLAWRALGVDEEARPRDSAVELFRSWQRGDLERIALITTGPPGTVRKTYKGQADDLGTWPAKVRLRSITEHSERATARYRSTFQLASDAIWNYDGTVRLTRTDEGWKVIWRVTNVHPDLTAGARFEMGREWSPRAPILAEDGTPLTIDAAVVTVGIEPQRMQDRAATIAALERDLGVDPNETNNRLNAPGVQPDYFVPIVTVPEAQYEAVKPTIYPVPGLLFRRSTQRQAATPQLAAHVVGNTGPITRELLDELGPPYSEASIVGRSGLERAYETTLAGTPALTVNLVQPENAVTSVLATFPGTPPAPVRTTLDLATQQRAETALGETSPAALVALRPSDGAVRAVVSTPVADGFNRALDGSYPPGSTFKVVTTAALLATGTTPDTVTSCPPTLTVNGREFKNFEDEAETSLSFRRAFALSCNNAFIGLVGNLPAGAIASSADQFGFGGEPTVGLAARGGSYPDPGDASGRAAAAIGQGRVTASPLTMAGVAGTAAAGAWHPPVLVLDPPTTDGPSRARLDPTVADNLRSLMTEVVQNGTGTAAAIAGRTIGGKTGTAEFGEATPPATHAWFIGFQDDLAFAVLVEGGGVGGRVAAPIARAFLAAG